MVVLSPIGFDVNTSNPHLVFHQKFLVCCFPVTHQRAFVLEDIVTVPALQGALTHGCSHILIFVVGPGQLEGNNCSGVSQNWGLFHVSYSVLCSVMVCGVC